MDFLGFIAILILIIAILSLVYYFILSNSESFSGFNIGVPNIGGSGEAEEMPSSANSNPITFGDDD